MPTFGDPASTPPAPFAADSGLSTASQPVVPAAEFTAAGADMQGASLPAPVDPASYVPAELAGTGSRPKPLQPSATRSVTGDNGPGAVTVRPAPSQFDQPAPIPAVSAAKGSGGTQPIQPSPTPDTDPSAIANSEHKAASHVVDAAVDPAPLPVVTNPSQEAIATLATASPLVSENGVPVPAPPPTTEAAPPADQIAPTLLSLAKTKDGNQQMTVRLHPEDLGMVQVRIERTPSGSTLIQITAEKSETLQALQRDQPRLHMTLDEAGIAAVGRTVTFHIVPPASGSSSGNGSNPHNASAQTAAGGPDADGSASGGKDGHPARDANRWFGGASPSNTPAASPASPPTGPIAQRVGLDITA